MDQIDAIGLMSGTSLDGVDVALISTDGEAVSGFGPTAFRAYSEAERALLRQALAEAVSLSDRRDRSGVLAAAERLVTDAHAEAVETFFKQNPGARSGVKVVGFHGQTVLHRPEQRLTVQIGDGAALARRLGLPVVSDFRGADVAAGGQGAPLVPVYHAALAQMARAAQPLAVLNIGGVANITFIDGSDLIACDTGPGNALLDDFVLRTTGQPFDADGALATTGKVDEAWLAKALTHPFFALPPPKSLDRNAFAALEQPAWSAADGAATLSVFTAASIARVVPLLPKPPSRWIVAGGGARNATIMRMLGDRLGVPVDAADSLGWSGDAIEAQAFAYLAARSMSGLPLSFPATTGVPRPMPGGVLARP